jgi:hypothetical protein
MPVKPVVGLRVVAGAVLAFNCPNTGQAPDGGFTKAAGVPPKVSRGVPANVG